MSPRGSWPRGGVRTRLPVVVVRRDSLHPEAADWVARVQANGSSVSSATADAVSAFCGAIDAAGIRSSIYRMNLFAGGAGANDPTRLNAALVPLYRGPSLSGTQFGNSTDTNGGGVFVSGDYTETGATGGLRGGGTRYLDTGFPMNTLPSTTSGHAAVYCPNRSSIVSFSGMIGVNVLSGSGFGISIDTSVYGCWGQLVFATNTTNGLLLASRTSSISQVTYVNGTSIATNATPTNPSASTLNAAVFANRASATVVNNYDSRRYCYYSIGLGLAQQQVTELTNAVQAFQTALTRNV